MNIIYLLNTTSASAGSSKSFLHLLEEARRHHNVLVVVPDRGEMYEILTAMGVRVEVLRYIFNMRPYLTTTKDKLIFPLRYVRLKMLNYLASRRLDKIAREFKADLYHANTSVTEIGYLSSRRTGIPHLTHVREYGLPDHHMHIPGQSRRLHSPNCHTICITRDIASYHKLLDADSNRVIYNPIVSEADFTWQPDKEDYLLYAGRINVTKGVYELIDAFIAYARRNPDGLNLRLAGSYKGARYEAIVAACNERLEQAGVRQRVEWLGDVRDVQQLMMRARAVVVPSLFEGFGRVAPESMAAGALFIGRDTGGTHEQFDNGLRLTGAEIGLRFTTTEEMARRFEEAEHMGPADYKGYVERAQHTVRELYLDKVSVARVMEFYAEIARKSSK